MTPELTDDQIGDVAERVREREYLRANALPQVPLPSEGSLEREIYDREQQRLRDAAREREESIARARVDREAAEAERALLWEANAPQRDAARRALPEVEAEIDAVQAQERELWRRKRELEATINRFAGS